MIVRLASFSCLLGGRVIVCFIFFEGGTICSRHKQKSEDIMGSYANFYCFVILLVAVAFRLPL